MLPAILFVSLTGCNTLNEPKIDICVIIDAEKARCIPVNPDNKEYDMFLEDMVGYMSVSPDAYGEIKKHHDELHKKLKGRK